MVSKCKIFICPSWNLSRCLQGLLKDRLVVLATHQVHFAILASKVLVLKEVSYYCCDFSSILSYCWMIRVKWRLMAAILNCYLVVLTLSISLALFLLRKWRKVNMISSCAKKKPMVWWVFFLLQFYIRCNRLWSTQCSFHWSFGRGHWCYKTIFLWYSRTIESYKGIRSWSNIWRGHFPIGYYFNFFSAHHWWMCKRWGMINIIVNACSFTSENAHACNSLAIICNMRKCPTF